MQGHERSGQVQAEKKTLNAAPVWVAMITGGSSQEIGDLVLEGCHELSRFHVTVPSGLLEQGSWARVD